MDAYIEPEGCEFFCEFCAPDGAIEYSDGGGEADCPQHCAACHRPLNNQLTAEGVSYVLEAVMDELRKSRDERDALADHWGPDTYYHGCTQTAVVRDWAEEIRYYGGLSERDEYVIDWYLRHSSSLPNS